MGGRESSLLDNADAPGVAPKTLASLRLFFTRSARSWALRKFVVGGMGSSASTGFGDPCLTSRDIGLGEAFRVGFIIEPDECLCKLGFGVIVADRRAVYDDEDAAVVEGDVDGCEGAANW